jgi:hypothetical protein
MNCPNTEQWDLLSMNLVGQAEEASLLAHAQDCDACRAALKRARRDHALLLRSSEVFHRRHDRLREELMAAVPAELPPRTLRLRGTRRGLLDLVPRLDTPARRVAAVLAPAACILIAVGILLTPGKSAVAFAAVLERMRQARTMVCDLTITMTTTVLEPESRTEERTVHQKLSMYSDGEAHLARIDQTDPPATLWIFPDHMLKIDGEGQRTVSKFEEQPLAYARCDLPDWWHDRLLKLTEEPDRELGQETLDGREVVGFEIAGWKLGYGARPTPGVDALPAPLALVRLWVDASTRLPVCIHIENAVATRMPGILSMEVSQTWEHIQYDVPLDPQAFQPPAPPVASEPGEDSELADLVEQMAHPSEERFLDALRDYPQQIRAVFGERFADQLPQFLDQPERRDDPEMAQAAALFGDIRDLLGHGYPPQLDASFLASVALKVSILAPSLERARELAARARGDADALARWTDEREAAAGNAEAAARLAEKQEPAREELERKLKALSRSIVAMQVFYQQLLVQDREPEYFGATVEPGDADAVLMRWKLDDMHMRVIYGDLRAETVAPDEHIGD